MKCMEKVAGLVWVLLATACSSGSATTTAPIATPAPAATTSNAIPATTPTTAGNAPSTPTPRPLTNDTMAAAALANFNAAPNPPDLIAWDVLDTDIIGDQVTLKLCAWNGQTVFDHVRLVQYIIETDELESPRAELLFSTPTPDNCLNTELITTALAATRDYDRFWGAVLDDPTTWNPTQATNYLAPALVDDHDELVAAWNRDGVHWRDHGLDANLPSSSLQPLLWRRFSVDQGELLQLLACRTQSLEYGLYKGEQRVDSFSSDGVFGTNAIDRYSLQRLDDRWVVRAVGGNLWSNCSAIEPNWLSGVNEWMPEPVEWEPIDG